MKAHPRSTYALQHIWRAALAHMKRLDSLFKAGAGHDHSPERESSGIIRARAVPSAHRSCAVAFAPSSNWTIGVLRSYSGAINDYARPRFYKVDWHPTFGVISISVRQLNRPGWGKMPRSLNGRFKTVCPFLWIFLVSILVISEPNS